MMRILFIVGGFFRVGDYFRYTNIAESLVARGHSVTIVSSDPSRRFLSVRERVHGVEWVYAPYLGGLELAERMSRYLPETKIPLDVAYRVGHAMRRAKRFDVVHVFHPGFNTFLPLMAAKRGRTTRPLIVYDCSDLWPGGIWEEPGKGILRRLDHRITSAIERAAITQADGVTVNTDFLRKRAIGLGVAPSHVELVPDRANSSSVKPLDRLLARRELGIPADSTVLGFSGFFHPDTELLLRAVAQVRKTHDVKLLMTGVVRDDLLQLMEKLNLKRNIILTGVVAQEEFSTCLGACDVLLLPFTDRPLNLARWPIKLGDYLAAGRPVVAGGYGVVAEFFEKYPEIGVAGECTVDSFADMIIDLLNDPGRRARAEKAARTVATEHLAWATSAETLDRFYAMRIASRFPGRK